MERNCGCNVRGCTGTGRHEGDTGGALTMREGCDARESASVRASHAMMCLSVA
jgi:hypothetical protein